MVDSLRRFLLFAETKDRQIVLTLSALVLIVGIPYSLFRGDHLTYLDAQSFYKIANNLAFAQFFSEDGQHPTAWRAPGYPFFLSVPVWLGADIAHLRMLNFVALSLSIYVLSATLRSVASPLAGLTAAVLVCS